jgi:MFS family permease
MARAADLLGRRRLFMTGLVIFAGGATAVALTGGFHWAFWVGGCTALAAVPVAFLLIRRKEIARAAAAALQREAAPQPGRGTRPTAVS